MKAVVIEKPGVMSLREVEIPEPAPGFARIAVKAAAICATDLEALDGNIPANYPITPGHEWSGVVDKVGDARDAVWVGKRVTGSNDVVCLTCEACRSGNWRYCADFEEIGFRRDGAYAEYFLVPTYGLCALPDSLAFDHAALTEPLGVALGTLEKSGAGFGDTLLILGAGPIGLCILAAARAMGMRKIVVAAASRKRLSAAEQFGAYAVIATEEENLMARMARLHPGGADVVIDATGVEQCVQDGLKLARKGGAVVLAGYGRGRVMNIRVDDIHINNLRVIGAGNNWNMHKKAASLMADGTVNVERLITEKITLDRFAEGLEMARSRPQGFIKAVFEI
jgi:2-desacetyl-2-hydroxyethyl bacteriochlorophyllide A dehydrogenase